MSEIQKEQLQEITNLLYHILVKLPATPPRVADDKLPTWLDNQDVMQLLHVSASTLLRWRKNGNLRFFKVNGKIWYQELDVHKLLIEQK
jgi:hypothetical protein